MTPQVCHLWGKTQVKHTQLLLQAQLHEPTTESVQAPWFLPHTTSLWELTSCALSLLHKSQVYTEVHRGPGPIHFEKCL